MFIMSELIDAEFKAKELGCNYFLEYLELESNLLKMGKNLDEILFNASVIDIGADCGSSAIFFFKHNAYRVHAFEIDTELCKKYDDNVKPILKHYSLYYYCKPANKQDVLTIIKNEKKDSHKVFLKVDCEGCEAEILDEEVMKEIDNGLIAIHDWIKQEKRQELVLLLKKYEYVPVFVSNDGREVEFMKI